jgi:hypothetical protein
MYDMILSNPVATQNLIEIFASEAGRKEFEVSGRISFVIDTKDEPEKGSLIAGTSASLRNLGEAASHESSGRRSAMQYGQPKGKRF